MTLPIYLDNNATTKIDPVVLEVMIEALKASPSNPSSIHSLGQKAKSALLKARETIAKTLRVKTQEIVFTSGGTESMNFLIRGLALPKTHIISSTIEHASLQKTLLDLKECSLTLIPSTLAGAPSLIDIEKAITPSTKLLVFSAVNGETGVKLDLEGISSLAVRHNIPLVIDGTALLGKELFTIPTGITGMGFSGHKFHGPQGSGFVFLRANTKIYPLLTGGGQEYTLRSGTENLPAILGLAKAVELIPTKLPQATLQMKELRDLFEHSLMNHFPFIQVNGTLDRICNVSNLAIAGVDAETLLIQLDLHGLQASHGSACSSGALEPSKVLQAMGLPLSLAKSSLRFSLSRFTTREEIEKAIFLLKELIPRLKTPIF